MSQSIKTSAYKLLSSSYKSLGSPDDVGRRFMEFLFSAKRCLAGMQSIAVALLGLTSVQNSIGVCSSDRKTDYSLEVDVFELCRLQPDLGNMILRFPSLLLPLLVEAVRFGIVDIMVAMTDPEKLSQNCKDEFESLISSVRLHARLVHLPPHFECCKPSIRLIEANDAGKMVQISGKVVRVSPALAFESEKFYQCSVKTCMRTFSVKADFETFNNALVQPTVCPERYSVSQCNCNKFIEVPGGSKLTDYQEVKIQENACNLKVGSIPRSLLIKLEDDLVDKCQPGDDVLVVGILIPQWQPVREEIDCEISMALRAHSIRVINSDEYATWDGVNVTGNHSSREELKKEFQIFWDKEGNKQSPISARNFICSAVCPKLYGMLPIKLALLLSLIGGASSNSCGTSRTRQKQKENAGHAVQFWEDEQSSKPINLHPPEGNSPILNRKRGYEKSLGPRRRTQPHMLLVGDPGTGKSQFLRFANAISPRSVMTTGVGTTSAGLTCAAVRHSSGKDFTLEAGALVLADRGVCCIDEFGCIRDEDRTTIHEAMEQQTISVAKAGIVCKLNTRATIFAVCNPKGALYQPEDSLSQNTGIGSPLLSRFDFIFILTDSSQEDRDRMIARFLLSNAIQGSGYDCPAPKRDSANETWSIDKLRCYIATVKDRFHPTVSSSAALLLERHYQTCRSQSNNTTHITVRFFESLIRLSQAHARLMHRNIVKIADAVAVILLMESSALRCGGMNPSFSNDGPGLIYCEPLHTDFPNRDEADEQFLMSQSRLLRRYHLIDILPEDQRRDEEVINSNVQAEIDAQVNAIYDQPSRKSLGQSTSQISVVTQPIYSQIEDGYGRKMWRQTPFSPSTEHQPIDSNKET